SNSDEAAMQADFQFHRRLMAITGNELMRNVLEVIQEFVFASMLRTTPKPRDRAASRQRHRRIVEAVRRRDPDAAQKAMLAHMQHTLIVLQERDAQRKQRA